MRANPPAAASPDPARISPLEGWDPVASETALGAPTGPQFSPAASLPQAMASHVTAPELDLTGPAIRIGTGLAYGAPVPQAVAGSFASLATPSAMLGLTVNKMAPALYGHHTTTRELEGIEAQNPGSLSGFVGRETAASPMEAEQFGQPAAYDAIETALDTGYSRSRSLMDQALGLARDKVRSMLGLSPAPVKRPPLTSAIYSHIGPARGSWGDILGHPDPMDAYDKSTDTVGRISGSRDVDPFGRAATPENPEPGFDTMGPASIGGISDGGFDPFGNPEAQARASRGSDFGGRGGGMGGGGGISSAGDYGGERGMGRDNTGGGYR